MKLTYSNWHKELVHDDNIQTELNSITNGELEFNNRPFVKHRTDNRSERDDYSSGGGRNQYRQNFGGKDNNRGPRDNRGGNRNNNNGGRDNRNNNRNFKKRY
jgi:hypothetical protein